MATVCAKIQIYPDEMQSELLLKTMKQYSAACNFVSKYIFEHKELRQKALHKQMYSYLRESYGLGSQMAYSTFGTSIARYKSAKSNGHEWSEINFKKPACDLVWNRDYSINKGLFSVNTLEGRVKLKYQPPRLFC